MTDKHCEETSAANESKQQTEDGVSTADPGGPLVWPGETTVKQVNPSGLSVDHGLDMTQLCKAFAEDFTQEENLEQPPGTSTRNNQSIVSTCMNVSEGQIMAESETQGGTDPRFNPKETSSFVKETTNSADVPVMEGLTSEGPNQDHESPAVASDFSRAASSCNDAERHLHLGFKTANNKIIFVPPEAVMTAKAALDDLEEQQLMTGSASSRKAEPTKAAHNRVLAELPSQRPGGETTDFKADGSSEMAAEHVPSSFLQQSSDSGFKTASNRSISVTSFNLEKAKDLFKQLDEEDSDLCPSSNNGELDVQNMKDTRHPIIDFKGNHSDHKNVEGCCFLTASQKADVTELCSMLEDGDSQYEFTQFRQAKLTSKMLDSKDWDPQILSGIDFDDSFNGDLDRKVSRKHQAKPDLPNQHAPIPTGVNTSKARHVPQETPDADPCLTDAGLTLRSDGNKTLKVEMNSREENKSFCVGFKTARGSAMCVSEKYLSKARSVFADLEDFEGDFSSKNDHKKAAVQKQSGDHHATERSRVEIHYRREKDERELESEENLCHGNTSAVTKETCKPICVTTNLDSARGQKDLKPDSLQSNKVNFGFSTAAGKELKVSEKSLRNAKKLLNEAANCEETPAKREAAVSSLKSPPGTKAVRTLPRSGSSFSVEEVCDSKTSDESFIKDKEQNSENRQYRTTQSAQGTGFKSANGRAVVVSARSTEKSKTFFKDIDSCVDASDETKSREENSNMDLEVERRQHSLVNGFKMASGKGVSFSEKAFMKAKAFFEDCDLECTDSSRGKGVMDSCGFKAVAGNTVQLPEIDGLSKEAASLKEEPVVLNKYVKKEFTETSAEILQSTSGCGFSTASGKTVSVSAEAVQRAKALFHESSDASLCEKTIKISEEKRVPQTEAVVQERSRGFSTASGRKVAISDTALEKARNLFSDCETESLTPKGSLLASTKTSQVVDSEQAGGFSTAGGGGVVASEKECEVDSCSTLHSCAEALGSRGRSVPTSGDRSEGRSEIIQAENSKVDSLRTRNFGFSTASGKGVSVSESALRAAFGMLKDCAGVPEDHCQISKTECFKINEKCPPVVPESGQTRETTLSLTSQAIQNDSSPLNCHSLSINGCTMTQQWYFEQEAMACTKAFLEDDLKEHSPVVTLEDTGIRKPATPPQHRSSEATKGERKRTSGEDLTGKTFSVSEHE